MITKAQLPHVQGRRLPNGAFIEPIRPVLHCDACGEFWSATPGDYWQLPSDHVFICADCRTPLRLVRKVTTWEDWE